MIVNCFVCTRGADCTVAEFVMAMRTSGKRDLLPKTTAQNSHIGQYNGAEILRYALQHVLAKFLARLIIDGFLEVI